MLTPAMQSAVHEAASDLADKVLASALAPDVDPRASAPAPGSVEAVVRARLSRAPLVQRQAAAKRSFRARAVPTPVASKPAVRPAFRRPIPQAAVTQGQILLEALTATCVKDSAELGEDDIALAAFLVDVNAGVVVKSGAVSLGGFRQGESVPLALGALSHIVRDDQAFPATYIAVGCLAEQDRGGFDVFLNDVLVALLAKTEAPAPDSTASKLYLGGTVVAAALGGAAITALLAGAVPASVGLIVASMIVEALTLIVAGVAAIVQDELFPPATRLVTLDAFGDPLANGLTEEFVFSFERSIASYTVNARFRLQA
jgi:hypothetical protein